MSRFTWLISSILVAFFIQEHEAAAPLFLQAITSALATIPFTGGPMTTGLVGAKLAIGTKLLYYLGLFGKKSTPKPKSVSTKSVAPKLPSGAGSSGGLQPLPLPYFLSGVGRFPQMGVGFGAQETFHQNPFEGTDPAELFQALRAQGFEPNTAMQMINYGGFANVPQGGGFANVPQSGFAQGGGFANVPQSGFAQGGGFSQGGGFANVPQGGFAQGGGFGLGGGFAQGGGFASVNQGIPHSSPAESFQDLPIENKPSDEDASQDIENFFTFLQDMDENSCISRLVCDIGDNPAFLGDFSENIHTIVRSLDATSTNSASPYIEIMETGRKEGSCSTKFPECSDTAYEIVKNIAPSVSVPENLPI